MESNKITDSSRRVINFTLAVAAIIFICCVVSDLFGLAICRYVWSDTIVDYYAPLSRNGSDLSFDIFVAIFYLHINTRLPFAVFLIWDYTIPVLQICVIF